MMYPLVAANQQIWHSSKSTILSIYQQGSGKFMPSGCGRMRILRLYMTSVRESEFSKQICTKRPWTKELKKMSLLQNWKMMRMSSTSILTRSLMRMKNDPWLNLTITQVIRSHGSGGRRISQRKRKRNNKMFIFFSTMLECDATQFVLRNKIVFLFNNQSRSSITYFVVHSRW